MADDPTIPDDAVIWRYVVPQWIVPGKDGQRSLPSTGAFEDSSDGDPMSAILASKDRDPATAVPKTSPDAGVVAFTAGFLRGLGLELERAPEPEEPDHILVRGNKTKSLRNALKNNARWVHEGKKSAD
jgi:hypothetical protein